MISKTLLFNKGVYKSTVRRYAWGSILYFVLLFLFTGMAILLNENPVEINIDYTGAETPLLLRDEYMIFSMLLSIVVPNVAGLLIFRYIHSKKASVFVHSLPVKRSANYISSVLAALTLMIIPIILNTGCLMLISASAYAERFTASDCLVWMLLNLFSVFVMFSCTCFVSSITGNSFGMIGLSVLFHSIGIIFAAVSGVICNVFVYGFLGTNDFVQKIYESTFIARVPDIMLSWGRTAIKHDFSCVKDIVVFIIVAVVLYIVAGILCNKRRIETAEDVAGFKCLNYIFKYLVTFIAAIGAFSIFVFSANNSQLMLWIMVFIISALTYFGAEMLLKKTFRVWKSYKGYLAFAAVFSILMCVFAFTSFFGYETYIPEKSDIKSVNVIEEYTNKDFMFADENMVDKALNFHREFVSDRKAMIVSSYAGRRIQIKYELKNGKTILRTYQVDNEQCNEIMNSLYENEGYKKFDEEIFTSAETTYRIELKNHGNLFGEIEDEKQLTELLECIQKDVISLSYTQLSATGFGLAAEVYYTPNKNAKHSEMSEYEEYSLTTYQSINSNYINTINWMKANGYWESAKIHNVGIMYIGFDDDNIYSAIESDEFEQVLKIEKKEDIDKIIEFAHTQPRDYIPADEAYLIAHRTDLSSNYYFRVCEITLDEIAELLPNYDLEQLK